MITKAMALALKHGRVLYHCTMTNADGTPLRCRVSGQCQTWKTRPEHFRVPIKHGLWGYGDITHETAHLWCLTEQAIVMERGMPSYVERQTKAMGFKGEMVYLNPYSAARITNLTRRYE